MELLRLGRLMATGLVAGVLLLSSSASRAQVLYFIEVDHLNTPRYIADQNGSAVWRWDQGEPFGNDVPNENPSGLGTLVVPLRFPGQYFDRETNLAYNWMRDYDPGIGRYVESDPMGLIGGINVYAYANNPLSEIDPTGLMSCKGEWKFQGFIEQTPRALRLCTCYWLCVPCDRPALWSGNKTDLPSTGGQLFYDSQGGKLKTGNRCLCGKPGPDEPCKPCQSK